MKVQSRDLKSFYPERLGDMFLKYQNILLACMYNMSSHPFFLIAALPF